MGKDLDAVIAKILRLRSLATSDNVHEAAAAAAAAERLIAAYHIEEAELEARSGGAASGALDDRAPLITWRGAAPAWHRALAAALAEHYGCVVYRERWGKGKGRQTDLYAFGRPEDVATLRYMLAWLGIEIARLGKDHPRRTRQAFMHGAVHGVLIAMRQARDEIRKTASSAALAIFDERLSKAAEAFEAEYGKWSARPIRKPKNEDAYVKGYVEGHKLGKKQNPKLKEADS
jgi:uncharacterized protein DUF2786